MQKKIVMQYLENNKERSIII